MIIRTPVLPEPRSRERYENLKALMPIASEMGRVGWAIDRARAKQHLRACAERAEQYAALFCQLSGLNADRLGKQGVGQTQAVRDWFLVTNKAPAVSLDKFTKKPQVNSAALTEWANRHKDTAFGPAAAALYGLRKNKKYGQYLSAYLALSEADGRIHGSFLPFGTKTGRWTSGAKVSLPGPDGELVEYGANLQQVPQQEPTFDFGAGPVKLVQSLRDVFVADEGCVVGSADFQALEFRLIGTLFRVSKLNQFLAEGRDTHWENARALFKEYNLPEAYDEKLHKKFRNGAKSFAYALAYQYREEGKESKYPTVLKTVQEKFPNMTMEMVCRFADRYFALYPEIIDRHAEIRALIDAEGYREIGISGRRIYYPSSSRGYNSAINLTFQSSGAELINRAIREIAAQCDWRVGGFYILAMVHDEIVVNVPKDRIEECKAIVETAMSRVADFGDGVQASIPAEMKTGASWPK